MNLEQLHEFCMSLPGATETFPFDEVTLVYKVMNKMYGLIPLDNPVPQISVKCDPDRAIILREKYTCIVPAWHFNQKHWNTIIMDPGISEKEVKELIVHSYELVVSGLPKKLKEDLKNL